MSKNRPVAPAFAGAAEIPPGPNAGRVWDERPVARRDDVSGLVVTQLTAYRGHSHHVVATAPCWIERGRRLVIVSDREGCGNLFALDFSGQALVQLTDLRGALRPRGVRLLTESRLGFWYGDTFFELELKSLRICAVTPPTAEPVRPAAKPGWRVGCAVLRDGRQAVWLSTGGGRNASVRRVVAVTAGSDRAPFAATLPCVRPTVDQVVFASDADGYAQIYAVEIRRLAALPALEEMLR